MLSISKSSISADQAAKLAHQLILLINTFSDPVIRYKEKSYICYTTKSLASKIVGKRLIRCNTFILKMLILAFLLIFYPKLIPQ